MKVGLFLFAYNQEKFIAEAVESVLKQDTTVIRVVLSDDASTDKTQEIIQEIVSRYKVNYEIIINFNKKNLGLIKHVNLLFRKYAMDLDIVIFQAGDDVSQIDRVSKLLKYFAIRDVSLIYSNALSIDDKSYVSQKKVLSNRKEFCTALDYSALGHTGVLGSSVAIKVDIFREFGFLSENLAHEDQVLAFRASLLKGVFFVDEEMILYRQHPKNLSKWAKGSHALVDLKKARISQLKNTILTLEHWLLDVDIDVIGKLKGINKGKVVNNINNHLVFNRALLQIVDLPFLHRLSYLKLLIKKEAYRSTYALKIIISIFYLNYYLRKIN